MIIFDASQLLRNSFGVGKNSRLVFPLASAGAVAGGRSDAGLLAMASLQGKPAKFADFTKMAKPQGETLLNSNDLQNSKSDLQSLLPIRSACLSLAVRPLALAVRLCARLGGGGTPARSLSLYIYILSRKKFFWDKKDTEKSKIECLYILEKFDKNTPKIFKKTLPKNSKRTHPSV